MDERLLPEHRIRRRTDYQRCYREGRKHHGPLAVVHFVPNELNHPRIGITASRKVGGAVTRHRLKRRIKEVYRRWKRRERLPGVDFVVHLKPAARDASFEELRDELLRLISRLGRQDGPRDGRRRRRRRPRRAEPEAS